MKPVILLIRCSNSETRMQLAQSIENARFKCSDTCYLFGTPALASTALQAAARILDRSKDEYFLLPVGQQVVAACDQASLEQLNASELCLSVFNVPRSFGESDQNAQKRRPTKLGQTKVQACADAADVINPHPSVVTPVLLQVRCVGRLNPHLTDEELTHCIGGASVLEFPSAVYLCMSTAQAGIALQKIARLLNPKDEYFVFPVGPEVIAACTTDTWKKLVTANLSVCRVPRELGHVDES
jgi:hypothetical protein